MYAKLPFRKRSCILISVAVFFWFFACFLEMACCSTSFAYLFPPQLMLCAPWTSPDLLQNPMFCPSDTLFCHLQMSSTTRHLFLLENRPSINTEINKHRKHILNLLHGKKNITESQTWEEAYPTVNNTAASVLKLESRRIGACTA
jgi:hypothetical protein